MNGEGGAPLSILVFLVFRANEKFDAEGRLTDERTPQNLAKFLTAFADWMRHWLPR